MDQTRLELACTKQLYVLNFSMDQLFSILTFAKMR